jgi:hypothetical protein
MAHLPPLDTEDLIHFSDLTPGMQAQVRASNRPLNPVPELQISNDIFLDELSQKVTHPSQSFNTS